MRYSGSPIIALNSLGKTRPLKNVTRLIGNYKLVGLGRALKRVLINMKSVAGLCYEPRVLNVQARSLRLTNAPLDAIHQRERALTSIARP